MTARVFKHQNRLAKKALIPNKGKTREEAVANAQERLEGMRDISIAEIDRTIEEIIELGRAIESAEDERVTTLYAAANRILAIAGVFDLNELGDASYSLCELVSRMDESGIWKRDMVLIHVDAIQVMRNPDQHGEAQREALRAGLRQLLEQVA